MSKIKKLDEFIELSKNEFFDRLVNHGDFPSTSQPTPHAFLEIFEEDELHDIRKIATRKNESRFIII